MTWRVASLAGLAFLLVQPPQAPDCGDQWYGGCVSKVCLEELEQVLQIEDAAARQARLQQWRQSCQRRPITVKPSEPPKPTQPMSAPKSQDGPVDVAVPSAPSPADESASSHQQRSNWYWGVPVKPTRTYCSNPDPDNWAASICLTTSCPATTAACRRRYTLPLSVVVGPASRVLDFEHLALSASERQLGHLHDGYEMDFFGFANWLTGDDSHNRFRTLIFTDTGARVIRDDGGEPDVRAVRIEASYLQFRHEIESRAPPERPTSLDRRVLALRTFVAFDPELRIVVGDRDDAETLCVAARVGLSEEAFDLLCTRLTGDDHGVFAPLDMDLVAQGSTSDLVGRWREGAPVGAAMTAALRATGEIFPYEWAECLHPRRSILFTASDAVIAFSGCAVKLFRDTGAPLALNPNTTAVLRAAIDPEDSSSHRDTLRALAARIVADPTVVIVAADAGAYCYLDTADSTVACESRDGAKWFPIDSGAPLAPVRQQVGAAVKAGSLIRDSLPLVEQLLQETLADRSRAVLSFGNVDQTGTLLALTPAAGIGWRSPEDCSAQFTLMSAEEKLPTTTRVRLLGSDVGQSCDDRFTAAMTLWPPAAALFSATAVEAIHALYFGASRVVLHFDRARSTYVAVVPAGRLTPTVLASELERCVSLPMRAAGGRLPTLDESLMAIARVTDAAPPRLGEPETRQWRLDGWVTNPLGLFLGATRGCGP